VTEAEQKMLPVLQSAINKLITELESGSVPSQIVVADADWNHRFEVVKLPGKTTQHSGQLLFDLKYAGSVKTTGMN
jgi:hypothetical protein